MKPIVIFGAGGFAREVLVLLEDINRVEPQWEILGFLEDAEHLEGAELNGYPILGNRHWLDTAAEKPYLVIGIGAPAAKRKLSIALRDNVAGFPSVVHPSATLSNRVAIGEGVVITAGNILTTEVELGDFSMLNLMCTVGHDTRIDPYVTVSPGVNVSGRVTIGEGTDVGTGSKLIQGVSIGAWSVIGAGAVVSKDLPPNCTAVGIPARPIKEREPGWHL